MEHQLEKPETSADSRAQASKVGGDESANSDAGHETRYKQQNKPSNQNYQAYRTAQTHTFLKSYQLDRFPRHKGKSERRCSKENQSHAC